MTFKSINRKYKEAKLLFQEQKWFFTNLNHESRQHVRIDIVIT